MAGYEEKIEKEVEVRMTRRKHDLEFIEMQGDFKSMQETWRIYEPLIKELVEERRIKIEILKKKHDFMLKVLQSTVTWALIAILGWGFIAAKGAIFGFLGKLIQPVHK